MLMVDTTMKFIVTRKPYFGHHYASFDHLSKADFTMLAVITPTAKLLPPTTNTYSTKEIHNKKHTKEIHNIAEVAPYRQKPETH